jgi:hypothetical protein
MKSVASGAVMAMLTAMTLSAGVRAEPSVTLTVRLYNTSGVPAPELVAARRAAESILRETGLNVIFRHCGRQVSPDDAVDPCVDRLAPSEVVVRVIHAPAFNTGIHPDAYGLAYVVQETGRGWLATVFSDRIDHAAARVGVEPGTLLGRVMAHEVGHLLLGSTYHAHAGLMRADWPDALLNRAGEEWRFSTTEAARMQSLVISAMRSPSDSPADPITF